jgi:hypothetical protein
VRRTTLASTPAVTMQVILQFCDYSASTCKRGALLQFKLTAAQADCCSSLLLRGVVLRRHVRHSKNNLYHSLPTALYSLSTCM